MLRMPVALHSFNWWWAMMIQYRGHDCSIRSYAGWNASCWVLIAGHFQIQNPYLNLLDYWISFKFKFKIITAPLLTRWSLREWSSQSARRLLLLEGDTVVKYRSIGSSLRHAGEPRYVLLVQEEKTLGGRAIRIEYCWGKGRRQAGGRFADWVLLLLACGRSTIRASSSLLLPPFHVFVISRLRSFCTCSAVT